MSRLRARKSTDKESHNIQKGGSNEPPFLFSARAMKVVVVEELILESQRVTVNIGLFTRTKMAGLSVMMLLDVALG